MKINIEYKGEHSGYRNNDVLYFQGGSHKIKSHLFILINNVIDGKIESFEWSYGNKQDNSIKSISEQKFGHYEGFGTYIGRKDNSTNKIYIAENLKDQFINKKCW